MTLSIGDHVSWTWGGGQAHGVVVARFTRKVTPKPGDTDATRSASPDEPAFLIRQKDGREVLKSSTEIDSPLTTASRSKGKTMLEITGLGGLIVLALSLWAIVSIIGSSASTGKKVLWCLFVLILPILGFIVWLFFGPRADRKAI
jgi:hypothetical protein